MNINNFEKDIASSLRNSSFSRKSFNSLDNFPLIEGKQAMYIMDWKNSKNTYQRGIKEMLGYEADEFKFDLVLNYFHPDDNEVVRRIIKGAVNHCTQLDYSGKNEYLHIKHRVKKKDNTYIQILRQTQIFNVSNEGRLVSTLSLITDISFVSSNKVEWDIYANQLDKEDFKNRIYIEFLDFFTPRELEIITLINNSMSTNFISKKLNISAYTVSTHRKNILRKSNCHSREELLVFCRKNGII